jgi:hypothetical protein
MVDLDVCYQKDPSIVSREVAGETILVPIRSNVGDLESIYTLNETAAYAWALIDGQHSLGQIRDQLVAGFEVDADEAQRDLLELATQLEEIQAITRL